MEREAEAKAMRFPAAEREKKLAQITAIRHIDNNWIAFERLYEVIGKTSYITIVREALTPNERLSGTTKELWKLRLKGMITLNLDRLATRCFLEAGKKDPIEITGFELKKIGILKERRQFIVHLHGHIEDLSSWVLRRSELTALQSKEEYNLFLTNIFASTTVLFVGISADDLAAGGTVSRLTETGFELGQHFWLTSRDDKVADDWAENSGLQIIHYDSKAGHSKALIEFIRSLEKFVPEDEKPSPVVSQRIEIQEKIPSPQDLINCDDEKIRESLNRKAKAILNSGDPLSEDIYKQFLREYHRPILLAWDVPKRVDPGLKIFSYEILNEVGGGTFGRVFKTKGADGNYYALKILNKELQGDDLMLNSFRRGVRSMQILSTHNVSGMVPYVDTYELPPCVVMDFIDGINLQDAIEGNLLDPWSDGLRILKSVAQIINKAHRLPERVLHRDIRPSNVMLKGFFDDIHTGWEVVVLDFDLSWHKDALEQSISQHASTALGYLAPEQANRVQGVSTRNTLVDTFGFGMTTYFVMTGKHPRAGDNLASNWMESIYEGIPKSGDSVIKSSRRRMARLIGEATKYEQKSRISFEGYKYYIEEMWNFFTEPENVSVLEFWVEEMAARAFSNLDRYSWNADLNSAEVQLVSGVNITLAEMPQKGIELTCEYSSKGTSNYRNISKFLPNAINKSRSTLKDAGWAVNHADRAGAYAKIVATVSRPDSLDTLEGYSRAVKEISTFFSFQ